MRWEALGQPSGFFHLTVIASAPVPEDIRGTFHVLDFSSRPNRRVSTRRLPQVGAELFGREVELARLRDAWEDPGTHVISVVAQGGIGKTALVKRWVSELSKQGYLGAARVFAWSFYSQGTWQASCDLFVDTALRWFGDPQPQEGDAWDKGERLAALIREQPTLLILDGIEPLQYPPGPNKGKLKDPAIATLLEELAGYNPGGLCVVSSRLALADVATEATAEVVKLGPLDSEAGARLLRARGVVGEDADLRAASDELGGHALAVYLLGGFLAQAHNGDLRRRDRLPALAHAEDRGAHARRVMSAYESWLPERDNAVLRLLGLFDRPASPELVAAIKKPPIAGLTDELARLSEVEWNCALSHLRELGLVVQIPDGALDAHPLVREHFGERLAETDPVAWKAGHLRLYEVLCKAAPEQPDTLPEMEPLLQAIAHGCAAGRYQEALDEGYGRRVWHGNEHFITQKLGAFAADLSALSHFFAEPWSRPQPSLTEADQSVVLSWAGFVLRGLGPVRRGRGHAGTT